MSAQHTPVPWHVGPHYKYDIESREGRICECNGMGSSRAVANAAFIVRACNSHDDLLKACVDVLAQFAAGYFVRNTDSDGCSDWAIKAMEPPRALAAMKAAVAKAEGSPIAAEGEAGR